MTQTNEIRPTQAARRSRKQLRSPKPEVRERLLDAGDELIREQGFPELRVDAIAARAGLSVGTFYLYFEGKDDLFTSLVVRHTERIRAHRREATAKASSVLEQLTLGLHAYLDFVEENDRGFLYFRSAGSVQTNVGDLKAWAFAQHANDLRPLFEAGMANGEIRKQDLDLLVQATLGAMQHLAGYWLENRERFNRAQITAFFLNLSVSQLAPRPEESAS